MKQFILMVIEKTMVDFLLQEMGSFNYLKTDQDNTTNNQNKLL